MKAVIVIPAFQPGVDLPTMVAQLSAAGYPVILIDDGSSPDAADLFEQSLSHCNVTLVRHAINLGKGSALRTGMNEALVRFPAAPGIVTADADGQHRVIDILDVAAHLEASPRSLVLGVRTFTGSVPFRSRFGNLITQRLVRVLVGSAIQDSQTGLRGIPAYLARELLRLSSPGYEFELDMLVMAKHLHVAIAQVPIETVYIDHNRSSHFRPFRDSMKIYFVLFRFSLLSLATAILDNVIFVPVFLLTRNIALSQVLARVCAGSFNYITARRAVFLSHQKHSRSLPRYLVLALANVLLSYSLLTFLNARLGLGVFFSKIAAESFLFCANFALQRDFVFTQKQRP